MRILYVGWGFTPFRTGGSLRYAESVMEGMAARGHRVGYFCAGSFSLPPRRTSSLQRRVRNGVEMFEVRDSPIVPGWGLGTKDPKNEVECPPLCAHLEAVLAVFRPEIVHIHDLHAMSADLVGAAKRFGCPVLCSLHDYGPLCPTYHLFRHDRIVCTDYKNGRECIRCSVQAPRDTTAFRWALGAHSLFGHRGGASVSYPASVAKAILRGRSSREEYPEGEDGAAFADRRGAFVKALSSADLLLPVSRRVADLYAAYGVSGPKVRVLHPQLPHHGRIRPVERTPRKDGRVRFGYLGALIPAKGIEVLLASYGRMGRKEETELRIHGPCDPKYREALIRRFPDGMAGYRGPFRPDQLQEILSGIDVGIFPSVCEETYGMTVLEFLLAGIPVIASRIGGVPEVVANARNGLLVPPGDPDMLAAAIDKMIDDMDASRVLSRELFRLESYGSHLCDLENQIRDIV